MTENETLFEKHSKLSKEDLEKQIELLYKKNLQKTPLKGESFLDLFNSDWIIKNYERQLCKIICDPQEKELEQIADIILKEIKLGIEADDNKIHGLIVTLLLGLGLEYALAGLIATLVYKFFLKPMYDDLCKKWKESLNI